MRLILTRHGKTLENEAGIVQGQMQGRLSTLGKRQAGRLAARLSKEKISAVYSSDLARAADTAKIIARKHKLKVRTLKEYREADFGRLTGRNKTEIDWNKIPRSVESTTSLRKRAKKTLDLLYRRHKDECVVLVGHGGINRAMIALILSKPAGFMHNIERQRNTAVNIFEIREGKKHKVHLMNCISHLEEKVFKEKNRKGHKKGF
jgi:broad specificity phosphatase PhoE